MTDDLSTRLLTAIDQVATDANDSRHRLQCRVAFSLGVERGQTEQTMAAGPVWDQLMAEARAVIGDADSGGTPDDLLLRLCQAHREIVGEYRWAKQKLMEAHAAGAGAHHVVREQVVVNAFGRVLAILAFGYGIEEVRP